MAQPASASGATIEDEGVELQDLLLPSKGSSFTDVESAETNLCEEANQASSAARAEFCFVAVPWVVVALIAALTIALKGSQWCKERIETLLDLLNSLPLAWTAFLVALCWVPSVWFSIPGIGLTLQLYAGYRFEIEMSWLFGALLTVAAMLLASFACYSLGRCGTSYFDAAQRGDYVYALVNSESRLQLLQSIALLRLSPLLPFTLVSYLLGKLPSVSWSLYALGTIIGLLPPCVALAYLGSLAETIAELLNKSSDSDAKSKARQSMVTQSMTLAVVVLTFLAAIGLGSVLLLRRRGNGPKFELPAQVS